MVLLFLIIQLFFLYLPMSFNFCAHCSLLYPSYPLWVFMPLWYSCSFSEDMWVECMSENIFSLSLPFNNYLWDWDCRLSVTVPRDFEDVYFTVFWNLWLQMKSQMEMVPQASCTGAAVPAELGCVPRSRQVDVLPKWCCLKDFMKVSFRRHDCMIDEIISHWWLNPISGLPLSWGWGRG